MTKKKYSFFARAYVKGIKIGIRTIDDVHPDSLKEEVIEIFKSEGLGVDGKPLQPKQPEQPREVEEVAEVDKPKEDKEPVEEDKEA